VLAGVNTQSQSGWVTQQARNTYSRQNDDTSPRFLIHHRDAKFIGPFAVFESEGTTIILTPYRAPRVLVFAERSVLTVRSEGLDWVLIRSRRLLERVLRDYVHHYVAARPDRALALKTPEPLGDPERRTAVRFKRSDILGGLIAEYDLEAQRGQFAFCRRAGLIYCLLVMAAIASDPCGSLSAVTANLRPGIQILPK
jgi:hypothetical protein